MPEFSPYELPLYRLFQRLKGERFPLGVDQYEWALIALQHGRGIQSVESLRNLCKTLWLNHQENEWTFDFQFDQVMAEFLAEEKSEKEKSDIEKPKEDSASDEDSPSEKEKNSSAEQLPAPKELISSKKKHSSKPQNQETPSTADQATIFHQSIQQKKSFILSSKHAPISLRQMKQSWRYLRVLERMGAKTEIDLLETIKHIAKTGNFVQPQLQPPLNNQVDLKLLIDWEGSMIPFHSLARQFVQTSTLDHPKTETYYFHDTPGKNLFLDPYKEKYISLNDWLKNCDARKSRVLIFSDAGAARKSFSQGRIEQTQTFLKSLRANCKHMVWLNPMPISRWEGSSAARIEELIPMFEATRAGMDGAVDVLRGKNYK